MEKLEMVEMVMDKCGVDYEEAKAALEACDFDVLEAVVMIERSHRVAAADEPTATYSVPSQGEAQRSVSAGEPAGSGAWNAFCDHARSFVRSSMDAQFVVERRGERVLALPVLLVVLGLFMWGATLWLMVIGLFFGLRYHIEGTGRVVADVNEAMGKAADAADSIRGSMA